MLTEKQRLDHIMGGNETCPACGSTQIDGGPFECCVTSAWQTVSCLECEYEWVDTYSLNDVQTVPTTEPDIATVRELRTALDGALTIFDELWAATDGWEERPEVIGARAALAKGFPDLTPDPENETIE